MNVFKQVRGSKPKRNKFDLTHDVKMSLNMGDLIPFFWEEVNPSESFKCQSEIFMRMSPMIAPLMHMVNVYTHFYFVPNRIIWNEWEKFITAGETGNEAPLHPNLAIAEATKDYFQKKSLADYLGIPPIGDNNLTGNMGINALPFRAYTEIYNEYYRDQNLEERIEYDKSSGQIGQHADIAVLRGRAWEKDYYTSCLPWAQRGGDVVIPTAAGFRTEVQELDGEQAETGGLLRTQFMAQPESQEGQTGIAIDSSGEPVNIVNSVNVNDLRTSVRLQEWLEKQARGGSRYIETILSQFGIMGKDARLQRPEMIGGGRSPVTISEVLQTSETSESPQGNMSGHGISVGVNHGFKKSFTEHGIVMGIMSILPKTAYQDGLHRSWRRFDNLDYYWPKFANLGEQTVHNWEVYNDIDDPRNYDDFGYQQRYAEYKYKPSRVAGDFRDTLDFYHMGRKFEDRPVLNNDFVKADPTQRIFAVTDEDEDKLYCQVLNKVSALRPMPILSTPTI